MLDRHYLRFERERTQEGSDIEAVAFKLPDIVTPTVQLQCFAEVMGEDRRCVKVLREHGEDVLRGQLVVSGYPPYRKYIVVGVRHDLTIKSKMVRFSKGVETSSQFSFEDRLHTTHGLSVLSTSAPMLEVGAPLCDDGIRVMTSSQVIQGSTNQLVHATREDYVHLHPELCWVCSAR